MPFDLTASTLVVTRDQQPLFQLDLIEAQMAFESLEGKTSREVLDGIISFVENHAQVRITYSEATELLAAIPVAYRSFKKKLDAKLMSHFGSD